MEILYNNWNVNFKGGKVNSSGKTKIGMWPTVKEAEEQRNVMGSFQPGLQLSRVRSQCGLKVRQKLLNLKNCTGF